MKAWLFWVNRNLILQIINNNSGNVFRKPNALLSSEAFGVTLVTSKASHGKKKAMTGKVP